MYGADYLFLIILLVSLVLGVLRGFIREAVSVLSWLGGLWLAWRFGYLVYPWLGGALAEPGVREWAGRGAVFIAVLLVGTAAGAIISHYARRATGLSAVDRLLGGVFGLLRAVVLIGLLVIAARAVGLDGEAWWSRTRSMPLAETTANWLERYAEPAARDLLEQASDAGR
ncbi:MAG: CvpA family protein [Gammaproteobacteria bacterium]|nr:CvpA family protein [Gammaproteobacteria bacterium]